MSLRKAVFYLSLSMFITNNVTSPCKAMDKDLWEQSGRIHASSSPSSSSLNLGDSTSEDTHDLVKLVAIPVAAVLITGTVWLMKKLFWSTSGNTSSDTAKNASTAPATSTHPSATAIVSPATPVVLASDGTTDTSAVKSIHVNETAGGTIAGSPSSPILSASINITDAPVAESTPLREAAAGTIVNSPTIQLASDNTTDAFVAESAETDNRTAVAPVAVHMLPVTENLTDFYRDDNDRASAATLEATDAPSTHVAVWTNTSALGFKLNEGSSAMKVNMHEIQEYEGDIKTIKTPTGGFIFVLPNKSYISLEVYNGREEVSYPSQRMFTEERSRLRKVPESVTGLLASQVREALKLPSLQTFAGKIDEALSQAMRAPSAQVRTFRAADNSLKEFLLIQTGERIIHVTSGILEDNSSTEITARKHLDEAFKALTIATDNHEQ